MDAQQTNRSQPSSNDIVRRKPVCIIPKIYHQEDDTESPKNTLPEGLLVHGNLVRSIPPPDYAVEC